jgi:hypothetical protein
MPGVQTINRFFNFLSMFKICLFILTPDVFYNMKAGDLMMIKCYNLSMLETFFKFDTQYLKYFQNYMTEILNAFKLECSMLKICHNFMANILLSKSSWYS